MTRSHAPLSEPLQRKGTKELSTLLLTPSQVALSYLSVSLSPMTLDLPKELLPRIEAPRGRDPLNGGEDVIDLSKPTVWTLPSHKITNPATLRGHNVTYYK